MIYEREMLFDADFNFIKRATGWGSDRKEVNLENIWEHDCTNGEEDGCQVCALRENI